MDYTALKTNIQDIVENTFTTDQLNLFIQQAEQKIYNLVQFPAIRKNVSGNLSVGNKFMGLPTDFLYSYSLAIKNGNNYDYLLQKDVNFIREAYPDDTAQGVPQHYAYFDDDYILLGPTPNTAFYVELHYGHYPESIVTAGTTPWLGTDFDSALLNGALMEAARFMKSEQDVVAMYEKEYVQSIKLLQNLGDGKLRKDAYRNGQYNQRK
jgi:hypothetical protein